MQIHLTPDQESFARLAVEAGRFNHKEDAVREALALWEERERSRAELLASLDAADAALARGEGLVITEDSMRDLARDISERGRARLAAYHNDL